MDRTFSERPLPLNGAAPRWIQVLNPLVTRLLGHRMPMGPNTLITIRGRKSGVPRTIPLALMQIDGRDWLVGTFGNTHWVQNLRAAGEAVMASEQPPRPVIARELSPEEGTVFFRDILPAHLRRSSLSTRVASNVFIRVFAPEIFRDPENAARHRPVFELVTEPSRP